MTSDSEARQHHPEGCILGPYSMLHLLASGANGDVYKARHSELGDDAALKVMPITGAANWEPRFAGLMCQPSHPNLVSVHFAERIDNQFVIAMDFVNARTLRDVLREKGNLDLMEALRICSSVASALACIHGVPSEGLPRLAHLCLRPSNVFLEWNGVVRISDFGIPQALGMEIPAAIGTESLPAYFAPEQIAGAPSPKSDLWAVGILLLEMLLGTAPFRDKTLEDYRVGILEKDLELGPTLANLPASVVVIILGCLRRDPADRYASASELAAELEAAVSVPSSSKCPKCASDLLPGSAVCPECTSVELRESLSQENRSGQKLRRGIPALKFDWLTGMILLAASAIALSLYLLWQSWQPRQDFAESPRPKPAMRSRQPIPAKTSGNPTGSTGQNPSGILPPASEAARREWEDILALEKTTGGSYEERIGRFRKFAASFPGTSESRQAQERLRVWENESQAFRAADELERKPGAKMCAILAQWRDFLAHQTTALRRTHAREHIRRWEKEVEDYTGYAELTVHSASGLPVADTALFGRGQPDPYLVLLDGEKVLYRSTTLKDNSSPRWDAPVRVYLWRGMKLTLEIWDEDFIGRDLLVAQALMPLPLDGPYQITNGSILIDLEIQRDR